MTSPSPAKLEEEVRRFLADFPRLVFDCPLSTLLSIFVADPKLFYKLVLTDVEVRELTQAKMYTELARNFRSIVHGFKVIGDDGGTTGEIQFYGGPKEEGYVSGTVSFADGLTAREIRGRLDRIWSQHRITDALKSRSTPPTASAQV